MRRYGVRALRPAVILGFMRQRVEKHVLVGGKRCALVPFRSTPDLVIARDTELTAEMLGELQQRYVLVHGGLPLTTDHEGATHFQIPDAA